MKLGKNFIGHTYTAEGHHTFQTYNPKSNLANPTQFVEATALEVETAVNLASKAFGIYRKVSGSSKSKFLNAIADELQAISKEIIEHYCKESGLPEGRAKGELGRTIFQLKSFADLVDNGSWVEASIYTKTSSDIRKMNIPLGPVVVFGASNFPLAYSTAGGDTASALAAGCPVIVKSHPMHAGTGTLVSAAIIKAAKSHNMPDGVFSNLNTSGIEIGQHLVNHPKVKAVGFTGSTNAGKALMTIAAGRTEPIPVFAEMGSINPVVFLGYSLLDKTEEWAESYANSVTLAAGQFCTNPGLIIGIKSKEFSEFSQRLAAKIKAIQPQCMIHPNLKHSYQTTKDEVFSQTGVQRLLDPKPSALTNEVQGAVALINGQDFLKNPLFQREIFGPSTLLVACEDDVQLQDLLLILEGQLTATLIGSEQDLIKYQTLVEILQNKVGRLIFNGVPTGVEVCPSMTHGGPFPASSDSRFSAVGIHAIKRWVRPFSFQGFPNEALPNELKHKNPLKIKRSTYNE